MHYPDHNSEISTEFQRYLARSKDVSHIKPSGKTLEASGGTQSSIFDFVATEAQSESRPRALASDLTPAVIMKELRAGTLNRYAALILQIFADRYAAGCSEVAFSIKGHLILACLSHLSNKNVVQVL